jgi:hypothetical protein
MDAAGAVVGSSVTSGGADEVPLPQAAMAIENKASKQCPLRWECFIA